MQVARSEHTGGVWPPVGVEVFDAFHLPFLNTMILLLSGCTVTWAHHALINGDRQGLVQGLGLTVRPGLLLTAIQAYESSPAAFGFTDALSSSTFHRATGHHRFNLPTAPPFLHHSSLPPHPH